MLTITVDDAEVLDGRALQRAKTVIAARCKELHRAAIGKKVTLQNGFCGTVVLMDTRKVTLRSKVGDTMDVGLTPARVKMLVKPPGPCGVPSVATLREA